MGPRTNEEKRAGGRLRLVLFGIPFLAVGIIAIIKAVLAILSGFGGTSFGIPFVIGEIVFGLLFTGVGLVLMFGKVQRGTTKGNGFHKMGKMMGKANPMGNKLATGCMFLFALPFTAVGVITIAKAIHAFFSGDPKSPDLIFELVFGIVFGSVGILILLGGRYGMRVAKEEMILRERYPEEPWKWRKEWATNRIKGTGKGSVAFAWIFAFFWNIVSWMVIAGNFRDLTGARDWRTLFVFLFPLIGLGLLIWAARATLRWRKYGQSTFSLSSVPGKVGDALSGMIETGIRELPDEGVTLTLNCVRKVRSSGRRSSTRETILWQEEKRVGRELMFRSPAGYGIPVEFQIPKESQETSRPAVNVEIIWRLHARASLPGVDFDTSFVVPVFKTGDIVAGADGETVADPSPHEEAERYDIRSGKVRVRPSPAGGTEFYFGPLRNPGLVISIVVFCAIWFGMLVPFFLRGTSPLFLLFFVIPGALPLLYLVRMLTGTTRVVADAGTIRIHRGVLGLTLRTIEIPRDEVEAVKLRIGMQKNPGAGSAGKAYYTIDVIRRDGSRVIAGRYVQDKGEASYIIEEIKRITGVGEKQSGRSDF